MKKRLTLTVLLFALCSGYVPHASAAAVAPTSLVVSEVQTGGLNANGTTNGRLEFVELFNPTAAALDLHGWQLNYFGGIGDIAGTPTRALAHLQGSVVAGGFVLVASPDFALAQPNVAVDVPFDAASTTTSTSGWLAQGGGAVQLADASGATRDALSWGSAKQNGAWWKAPEILPGSSVRRILPDDPAFTMDGVFGEPGTPTPQGGGLRQPPVVSPPACDGLELTEILPNTSGVDTGHEFIELHNPSATAVPLGGCSLRLGETGAPFVLPNESLASGAYRAFSDSESGITLPNAIGDTVWLISTSSEQGVHYADNLADDQSWAFINGTWQATLQPTPGTANILLLPSAGGQGSGVGDGELALCGPGKERNPETNRCRNVLAAATSLTPCKPDQERNPETNRCRSVAAATSALKPCAPGQERNPDTNRCRKVTSTGSFAKTQDTTTPSVASNVRWWLAGAAVLGAAGYGVYEWRTDIRRAVNKWRAKFAHSAATK
jgi:Lamin Tail Domain